jgi:phosphatidylserine synthase
MTPEAIDTPESNTSQPRWLLVECDGAAMPGTTRVAGLTLLGRHLKLAARLGFTGVVLSGHGDMIGMVSALPVAERPEGLEVQVTSGAHSYPVTTTVELAAVYDKATLEQTRPEPMFRLSGPEDVAACYRVLERSIRKSVDQDGFVAVLAFRPLSRQMTRVLINTPVMPNHISFLALSFGIAAAIVAGFGGHFMVALAGVLYWVGAVVDCVDGELARLRLQSSKLGEWIDTLADDVSTYGLMAGLGVGLHRHGADSFWLYVGTIGGVVGFLQQVKLYLDLHRWGMTIDTAQYPWFFGAPSDEGVASSGVVGRLTYFIGFLFRRDAFVTMIGIVLLFGAARTAVVGLLAGLGIFTVIFVVHFTLMATKKSAQQGVGA